MIAVAELPELSLEIIRGGVAAIGLLQTYAAEYIEEGQIKAYHSAAAGRLLVELGEVLLYANALSLERRRYTCDYVAD